MEIEINDELPKQDWDLIWHDLPMIEPRPSSARPILIGTIGAGLSIESLKRAMEDKQVDIIVDHFSKPAPRFEVPKMAEMPYDTTRYIKPKHHNSKSQWVNPKKKKSIKKQQKLSRKKNRK